MAGFNQKELMVAGNCKTFTIAGYASTEINVFCSKKDQITKAKRRYDSQKVPGRSGNLVYEQNALDNVKINYTFIAVLDGVARLNAWINHLLGLKGYQRIEDGFDPGYYWEGRICDVTGPSVGADSAVGPSAEVTITFDCKPQKWLKAGETWRTLTHGQRLNNYTPFECAPLYLLHGAGKVQVGASSLTIDSDITSDGIYFDSELGDAYYYRYGVIQPYNRHVTLAGDMHISPDGAELVQIVGDITGEAQLRNYET